MAQAAAVLGAAGGLGRALAQALVAEGWSVHAFSRSAAPIAGACSRFVDVTDEASLAAAAAAVEGDLDLVLVTAGVLTGRDATPERSLAEITASGLAESFRVNATGPALCAKHFAPLLPRKRRAVFAVLSARVGSISDNRLGGWYGYRASKAALNMLVRTAAIEIARTHPQAICVALHPGTVDTELSRPFQRGVPPGRLQAAGTAAQRLLGAVHGLTVESSGRLLDADGAPLPF